jgi:hypothetical protein
MKEEGMTIRQFLGNQKSNSEYKPDENFVLNLEKRLKNEIDLLKSKETKVKTKDAPQAKRAWRLSRNWAFAFTLLFIVAVASAFGGYTYLNRGKDPVTQVTPTPTPTGEPQITTGQILAAVNTKLEEIKVSSFITKYKVSQQGYDLLTGQKEDPLYCMRHIEFQKALEREECGYDFNPLIPMDQSIVKNGQRYTLYNKGEFIEGGKPFEGLRSTPIDVNSTRNTITYYPEFSVQYYKEIYGIDLEQSAVIGEDNNSYTLRSTWDMTNAIKEQKLKFYELDTKEKALQLHFDVRISKTTNLIENVKVSYRFESKTILAYDYTISQIESIEFNETIFDNKNLNLNVPDLIGSMGRNTPIDSKSDVSAKITGNAYDINFNAKAGTNYLIIKQEGGQNYLHTTLHQIIEGITANKVINVKVPFDSLNNPTGSKDVYVIPFKRSNGYTVYGELVDVTRDLSDKEWLYVQHENTSSILEYQNNLQLMNLGLQTRFLSSRQFETNKLKVKIPEGWEIDRLECYAGNCNSVMFRKNGYEYTIVSEALVTGGGFGSVYDGMYYNGDYTQQVWKTELVNFSDILQRVDNYIVGPFTSKQIEGNGIDIIDTSKPGDHWITSRFVVKGKYQDVPLIKWSDLTGKPQQNDGPAESMLIMYSYREKDIIVDPAEINASTAKITPPLRTSTELKQILAEMDAITKSIEFKK